MVLRMRNAQPVDPGQRPSSTLSCGQLAQRAGLPMPRVYVIDEDQPNAFATGRDPRACRGRGHHRPAAPMSREEIAGVMAHELAMCTSRHADHDHRRDPGGRHRHAGATSAACSAAARRERPARRSARSAAIAADDPGAARRRAGADGDQPQPRIRGRSRWARRSPASRVGSPRRWRSCTPARRRILNPTAEANPATRASVHHQPAVGRRLDSLFSTHPPMEERIRRLLAMAPPAPPRMAGWAAPPAATYPPGSPWGGGRRNPWG